MINVDKEFPEFNRSLETVLLETAMKSEFDTVEGIQKLIDTLFQICDDNWKGVLVSENRQIASNPLAVMVAMKETFASWDRFIAKLSIEDRLLFALVKRFGLNYKEAFMSNKSNQKGYGALSRSIKEFNKEDK